MLLIATAAVLPLVVYGAVSVSSLRSGTNGSVRQGNLNVAKQAAEQVGLYMSQNARVLQSIGAELGATGLTAWQQERILRDYVLDFPEFREITLFTADGQRSPPAPSARPNCRAGAGTAPARAPVHRPGQARRRCAADDDDRGAPDALAGRGRLGRRRDLARGSCGRWSTGSASASAATR